MKVWFIPLTAIITIGALAALALSLGYDTVTLASAFAVIGAIATGGTIKLWGRIKK